MLRALILIGHAVVREALIGADLIRDVRDTLAEWREYGKREADALSADRTEPW